MTAKELMDILNSDDYVEEGPYTGERIQIMDDKVQRYDHCSFNNVPAIDGKGEWVRYVDISSLHAAIIDLIDKTLSCTSGLSYGDCLEEIKRRLEAKDGRTNG